MQLYSCVVMACATNLYTIRMNTDFYIILGQKYGLPFQNCGMYDSPVGRSARRPTRAPSLPLLSSAILSLVAVASFFGWCPSYGN